LARLEHGEVEPDHDVIDVEIVGRSGRSVERSPEPDAEEEAPRWLQWFLQDGDRVTWRSGVLIFVIIALYIGSREAAEWLATVGAEQMPRASRLLLLPRLALEGFGALIAGFVWFSVGSNDDQTARYRLLRRLVLAVVLLHIGAVHESSLVVGFVVGSVIGILLTRYVSRHAPPGEKAATAPWWRYAAFVGSLVALEWVFLRPEEWTDGRPALVLVSAFLEGLFLMMFAVLGHWLSWVDGDLDAKQMRGCQGGCAETSALILALVGLVALGIWQGVEWLMHSPMGPEHWVRDEHPALTLFCAGGILGMMGGLKLLPKKE
jgi:hypothetical protein